VKIWLSSGPSVTGAGSNAVTGVSDGVPPNRNETSSGRTSSHRRAVA